MPRAIRSFAAFISMATPFAATLTNGKVRTALVVEE
jgi:hypothetical protein